MPACTAPLPRTWLNRAWQRISIWLTGTAELPAKPSSLPTPPGKELFVASHSQRSTYEANKCSLPRTWAHQVPPHGFVNAIPIWLPGDAQLAAKELAANPLGGEHFERNSHLACKLWRSKSSPPSDCVTGRRQMARHNDRDRLLRCKAPVGKSVRESLSSGGWGKSIQRSGHETSLRFGPSEADHPGRRPGRRSGHRPRHRSGDAWHYRQGRRESED